MDIISYALFKKQMGGKADLVNGKIPESQLPSYVDDAVEFDSLSEFPENGEEGKIYIAKDTGYTYRWSGSEYIQIGGQDLSDFYTKEESDAKFATIESVDTNLSTKSDATNLENGSGTNSLQQKTIKAEEPNIASGYESVAFNHETQAVQKACAAFGGGTVAGDNSIQNAESTYGFAFAIGEMSKALGRGSFSSGNSTEALNQYSATFGLGTKSSRDCELVAGTYNDITAIDMNKALFVVGNGTSTSSRHNALVVYENGIAELDNQGKTANSIVIYDTIPDLRKGTSARSIIQTHGAQANEASGQSAIALGMGNKATANRAVTIGEGLIGNVVNTTYVGKYNDSSIKNTLFVVGNGSDNSKRSNALTVYRDGHAEINAVGSTNNSITTKEYVDNHHDSSKQDKITNSITLGSTTLDEATLNRLLALLPSLPTKGQIISMNLDGTTRDYRVLSVDGTVAKVVAMFDSSTSQQFNVSSKTVQFSDGTTAQQYMNSNLDTYLNETGYNTLTTDAKAAIIEQDRIQDLGEFNDTGNPVFRREAYNYGLSDYSSKKSGTSPIGKRKVFALSCQEVYDYLELSSGDTMTWKSVYQMFWNDQNQHSNEFLGLSSAYVTTSNFIFDITGEYGMVGASSYGTYSRVRPALCLDLTKINYTIVE